MKARDRLLLALAGSIGPAWICTRRNAYRRIGSRIGGEDAVVLSRYFDLDLLASVRVAVVERIEEPWVFRVMSAVGRTPPVVMGGVSGLAVGDAVGVVRGSSRSTLFHELVHVAQYRRLGLGGFAREYVQGWIANDYEYAAIPLEAQAHALRARFDLGQVFSVAEAVAEGRP